MDLWTVRDAANNQIVLPGGECSVSACDKYCFLWHGDNDTLEDQLGRINRALDVQWTVEFDYIDDPAT